MRRHLNFLYETTKASFKLRNESSYLGVFWYLLGPLLTFGILLLVFSARLGSGVEHYPLYLLSGIVMWNFFSASTSSSLNAVMGQASLIKSLPVRRDLLVLSTVFDVFFSHVFELVILFGLMVYYGVLSETALFFPLIFILQLLFALGTGFALSSLHFVFRDLGQVWSVLMRAWWFATPIFYVLHEGGPGEKVNMFNPMYHSIDLSRDVLIYGKTPNITSLIIFACFAVAAYGIGYFIFSRISPRFAEYL
ncbi:ABC transporter permease [Patescibacteria group bacterium]|nr:ABC transporter permease [Patescibacteria group bacterium]